jgi:serine/threonine protein kinase, bacterial
MDMRLIDGKNLATMLSSFGPPSPPRAVAIVRQIGSALDAAHGAGVMHRDVKPENILVSADDFAYLVDFGIASATSDEKLTQFGTTVGTVKYMAPERFSDTEVTYRADIYALTCVLYECLTGSPPYASNFQPAENAPEDRTDGELAQLAKTVNADASALDCIKAGDDVGTAKAKATAGDATLTGLNATGTPFVWDGTRSVNYQDPTWLTKLIG